MKLKEMVHLFFFKLPKNDCYCQAFDTVLDSSLLVCFIVFIGLL